MHKRNTFLSVNVIDINYISILHHMDVKKIKSFYVQSTYSVPTLCYFFFNVVTRHTSSLNMLFIY